MNRLSEYITEFKELQDSLEEVCPYIRKKKGHITVNIKFN